MEEARRLQAGERVVPAGQHDMFNPLEDRIRQSIETAEPETITALVLSEVVDEEPLELVSLVRNALLPARPASDGTTRDGGPVWTSGHRYLCLVWTANNTLQRRTREAFQLAWERENEKSTGDRLSVPWLVDGEARLLGGGPGWLEALVPTLVQKRVITYRDLAVQGTLDDKYAKKLGRYMSRLAGMGLVVDRLRAKVPGSGEVNLPAVFAEYGRPRVYESVLAAARELILP